MALNTAAVRHDRCARQLSHNKEFAEACYLMGLAAECAIKHHLKENGLLRKKNPARKKKQDGHKDIIMLHFPELRHEILAQCHGILAGRLAAQFENAALLQGWNVRMRYKAGSGISFEKNFVAWRNQTSVLFSELGIL